MITEYFDLPDNPEGPEMGYPGDFETEADRMQNAYEQYGIDPSDINIIDDNTIEIDGQKITDKQFYDAADKISAGDFVGGFEEMGFNLSEDDYAYLDVLTQSFFDSLYGDGINEEILNNLDEFNAKFAEEGIDLDGKDGEDIANKDPANPDDVDDVKKMLDDNPSFRDKFYKLMDSIDENKEAKPDPDASKETTSKWQQFKDFMFKGALVAAFIALIGFVESVENDKNGCWLIQVGAGTLGRCKVQRLTCNPHSTGGTMCLPCADKSLDKDSDTMCDNPCTGGATKDKTVDCSTRIDNPIKSTSCSIPQTGDEGDCCTNCTCCASPGCQNTKNQCSYLCSCSTSWCPSGYVKNCVDLSFFQAMGAGIEKGASDLVNTLSGLFGGIFHILLIVGIVIGAVIVIALLIKLISK